MVDTDNVCDHHHLWLHFCSCTNTVNGVFVETLPKRIIRNKFTYQSTYLSVYKSELELCLFPGNDASDHEQVLEAKREGRPENLLQTELCAAANSVGRVPLRQQRTPRPHGQYEPIIPTVSTLCSQPETEKILHYTVTPH